MPKRLRWYNNTSVAAQLKRDNKKATYDAYMVSDEWLKIRAEVLRRDMGECQVCHAKGATQVHHLTYERFGTEQLSDLQSICADCHRNVHSPVR